MDTFRFSLGYYSPLITVPSLPITFSTSFNALLPVGVLKKNKKIIIQRKTTGHIIREGIRNLGEEEGPESKSEYGCFLLVPPGVPLWDLGDIM